MVEVTEADQLHLSDEDWEALEAELDRPVSEDARASLLECYEQFLSERKLEQEAISLRNVGKLLDTFATAQGAKLAEEDALQRIHRYLVDVTIEVDLDPDAGRDGTWDEPRQPHAARLTRRVAAEVVVHLRQAVAQAVGELDTELRVPSGKAFRPGLAFGHFLLNLRNWAGRHDLPDAVHNRNGVTAFSRFAHALHRRFPKHLQDRAASPRALQSRLNELVQEQKQRT
jgi:hypothetical protein